MKKKILILLVFLSTFFFMLGNNSDNNSFDLVELKEAEAASIPSTMVYMTPNSNWKQSNARFAVYFFTGSKNTWIDMIQIPNSETYYAVVPSDYASGTAIFCRMNPATSTNNWDNKWNQTGDLAVSSIKNKNYKISDWGSGSASTFTAPTIPNTVYFKPNSGWYSNSARFAAYFFNGGGNNTWVSMEKIENSDLYSVTVPNGYTNVIFVRMKGTSTTNDWGYKQHQTSDLSLLIGSNNLYKLKESATASDKGEGSWSAATLSSVTFKFSTNKALSGTPYANACVSFDGVNQNNIWFKVKMTEVSNEKYRGQKVYTVTVPVLYNCIDILQILDGATPLEPYALGKENVKATANNTSSFFNTERLYYHGTGDEDSQYTGWQEKVTTKFNYNGETQTISDVFKGDKVDPTNFSNKSDLVGWQVSSTSKCENYHAAPAIDGTYTAVVRDAVRIYYAVNKTNWNSTTPSINVNLGSINGAAVWKHMPLTLSTDDYLDKEIYYIDLPLISDTLPEISFYNGLELTSSGIKLSNVSKATIINNLYYNATSNGGWKKNVTITFHSNLKDIPNVVGNYFEGDLIEPPTITNDLDQREFTGWFDNSDLEGTKVTSITVTTSTTDYWAKWSEMFIAGTKIYLMISPDLMTEGNHLEANLYTDGIYAEPIMLEKLVNSDGSIIYYFVVSTTHLNLIIDCYNEETLVYQTNELNYKTDYTGYEILNRNNNILNGQWVKVSTLTSHNHNGSGETISVTHKSGYEVSINAMTNKSLENITIDGVISDVNKLVLLDSDIECTENWVDANYVHSNFIVYYKESINSLSEYISIPFWVGLSFYTEKDINNMPHVYESGYYYWLSISDNDGNLVPGKIGRYDTYNEMLADLADFVVEYSCLDELGDIDVEILKEEYTVILTIVDSSNNNVLLNSTLITSVKDHFDDYIVEEIESNSFDYETDIEQGIIYQLHEHTNVEGVCSVCGNLIEEALEEVDNDIEEVLSQTFGMPNIREKVYLKNKPDKKSYISVSKDYCYKQSLYYKKKKHAFGVISECIFTVLGKANYIELD